MRRYLLLVGVSLLFVAWSPFIGQIRDVIKRALGEAFSPVVGVLLGVTALALVNDRHRLSDLRGVLTPVAVAGELLCERLPGHGVTLTTTNLE